MREGSQVVTRAVVAKVMAAMAAAMAAATVAATVAVEADLQGHAKVLEATTAAVAVAASATGAATAVNGAAAATKKQKLLRKDRSRTVRTAVGSDGQPDTRPRSRWYQQPFAGDAQRARRRFSHLGPGEKGQPGN